MLPLICVLRKGKRNGASPTLHNMPDNNSGSNGEFDCAAAMIELLCRCFCHYLCEIVTEMCVSGDCNCCSKSADRNVIDYERAGVVLIGEEERGLLVPTQKTKYTTTVEADGSVAVTRQPNGAVRGTLATGNSTWRHTHRTIGCDECYMKPLVGTRYSKVGCKPSYDLCEADFNELSEDDRTQYEIIAKMGDPPVRYSVAPQQQQQQHAHTAYKIDLPSPSAPAAPAVYKIDSPTLAPAPAPTFKGAPLSAPVATPVPTAGGNKFCLQCGSPLSAPFCGECGARSGWTRATPAVAAPGRALSAPPPYGPPQSAQYE